MNVELLEKSFAVVAPKGEMLVHRFYDRLFRDYPQVKPMFEHLDQSEQERKLLASLVFIVQHLRDENKLVDFLKELGGRHVEYGTEADHYDAVATTLLLTLAEVAGDAWTEEVAQAWREALGVIKTVMLQGATAMSGKS